MDQEILDLLREKYDQVRPSPAFKQAVFDRLIARAAPERTSHHGLWTKAWAMRPTRQIWPDSRRLWRLIVVPIIALVMFLVTVGVETAVADSLPGDHLYSIKLAVEEARLSLMRDPYARVQFSMQRAATRLRETEALLARGDVVTPSELWRARQGVDTAWQIIDQLPVTQQRLAVTVFESMTQQVKPALETIARQTSGDVATTAEEVLRSYQAYEVRARRILTGRVESPPPGASSTLTSAPLPTATPTQSQIAMPIQSPAADSSVTATPVGEAPVVTEVPPTSTPVITSQPVVTSMPVATPSLPPMATNTPHPSNITPTPTACRGSIAGAVWLDQDRNGRKDENDTPLAGVTVTLRDQAGNTMRTTSSGGDGLYRLDGITPGIYTLEAAKQAGYRSISPDKWGIDLVCSQIIIDFGYQPEE